MYDISWANLNMLLASIPSFDDDIEEDTEDKDTTEQIDSLEEFEKFLRMGG